MPEILKMRFFGAMLFWLPIMTLGNIKETSFRKIFVDLQHWPNSKYGNVEDAR